jgi:hypothetical protein
VPSDFPKAVDRNGFFIAVRLSPPQVVISSAALPRFTFAEEKRNPEFEALTGAPGFRRFERVI